MAHIRRIREKIELNPSRPVSLITGKGLILTENGYLLSDISTLALGYIDDFPTYIGESSNGIVVLGFPKNSYRKLLLILKITEQESLNKN